MNLSNYREITFAVNGNKRTVLIDVRQSLLEVLREKFDLTGAKEGCGVGECGACSVLVDDILVDSCIYLAVWADGKKVRTVEGEATQGKLSNVQQAYVDEGAVQCGFCTSGFIMASTAFKEKWQGKTFSHDQIRREHAGNLCRCTGYQNIFEAIKKNF